MTRDQAFAYFFKTMGWTWADLYFWMLLWSWIIIDCWEISKAL